MRVSVIGSGYVGTTTSVCLAELGNKVTAIDKDKEVVDSINNKEPHIHEKGLNKLLEKHVGENLKATTDYKEALDTELTFICLPTPSKKDGSIDLTIIEKAAKELGKTLREKDGKHFVVVKSTVVPGSTKKIGKTIAETSNKELDNDLFLGMNPEFLREGTAIKDFMEPNKLVLGGHKRTRKKLKEIYSELIPETEVFEVDLETAELIKYANNSFLATKISYANEIGNLCKKLEIDSYKVMDALGTDERIERRFLDSGIGWGGSCFPKDVKALIKESKELNNKTSILEAALEVNKKQPIKLVKLLEKKVGSLENKEVSVLGLAFKPGTDDTRNSRSIPVIKELKKRKAEVIAHDPEAIQNMKEKIPDIEYKKDPEEAVEKAEACLILTDWPIYREIEINKPCIEGRRLNKCEGICWPKTN